MRTLSVGIGNFAAGLALITVPYLWLLVCIYFSYATYETFGSIFFICEEKLLHVFILSFYMNRWSLWSFFLLQNFLVTFECFGFFVCKKSTSTFQWIQNFIFFPHFPFQIISFSQNFATRVLRVFHKIDNSSHSNNPL